MSDDATLGATGSRAWRTPEGHWPHAARRCQDLLDLDQIEGQAIRILARGLRSQRLVAFVGAGASMAYGRLTWNGLMGTLYDMVEARATARGESDEGTQIWRRISKALWRENRAEFLRFDDHPLKAQVLSVALRHLPLAQAPGKARSPAFDVDPLLWETKFQLEDFHGFVDWLLAAKSPPDAPAERQDVVGRQSTRQSRKEWLTSESAKWLHTPDSPLGLRGALQVLAASPQLLPSVPRAAKESPLLMALLKALHRQSSNEDSPVRQLALDWGIRRYITTNYDHEIERGLGQLGFSANDAGPHVHDNEFRTLNFGAHETGGALSFALDGPRRHAAVLHLHGDVTHESSLIVTEQQYQALYLDDHPTRDLVTNATLANFAANPILFAGSGVNEDDINRPMRQFMSGEGHRRDRLAVALFPGDKPPEQLAAQKVRLLLKYGVHVVHFGWTDCDPKTQDPEQTPRRADSWLGDVSRMLREFTELQLAIQKKDPPPSADKLAKALDDKLGLWKDFAALPIPTRLDSQLIAETRALEIEGPIKKVKRLLPRIEERVARPDAWDARFNHFVLTLSVTSDWLASQFLCAKLMYLHKQAIECVSEDSRLPLVYTRPQDRLKASRFQVVSRHGVSLLHEDLKGRFERIDERIPTPTSGVKFDEGVESLCDTLRGPPETDEHKDKRPRFKNHRGRRVVVVCGARGHGKGGQADRLVARASAGSNEYPNLQRVAEAFGGYEGKNNHVLHVNLSFSNELGPIISQLAGALDRMCEPPKKEGPRPRTPDQLNEIGKGLQRLIDKKVKSPRLMVVLGNAGVLFDGDGYPKNGQVWRVLRMLMSTRFKDVPLDIVMYVGESQMPVELRTTVADRGTFLRKAASSKEPSKYAGDPRLRRRLDRLNIRADPVDGGHLVVHALARTRVSELAAAYFPAVAHRLGFTTRLRPRSDKAPKQYAAKGTDPDTLARRIYMATGGSRFATTVLLALLDTEPDGERKPRDGQPTPERTLAEEALTALSGPPSGSAIETVIEFALDRWARRHLLRKALPARAAPEAQVPSSPNVDALVGLMRSICSKPSAEGWQLASELLWHLGAFSHPVEAEVLLSCPRVRAAASRLLNVDIPLKKQTAVPLPSLLPLVRAYLELLVHWCLVFRVRPRPQPPAVEKLLKRRVPNCSRDRYAPHRHMQRHAMRLMGGRNVESTQWDQFTITTYASLPDEAPILPTQVHGTLTEVLRVLTGYPATGVPETAREATEELAPYRVHAMVLEADRIRAAYYLVRSTYSLGVIAHLSPTSADAAAGCGHLEEYRRLVRWITHAARYWEQRYGTDSLSSTQMPGGGSPTARAWCAGKAGSTEPGTPSGIFYPGELVWLYNECGVISLAQGTLHDAEQMLTMAERAAKHVEGDDSGSLHVRIRLHSGMVQVERGRPQRARQMLGPIAQRLNGHPVPPLLARFYLGLIDHLGGNYKAAEGYYERALAGLRRFRRSRAAAFVLINKADLVYAMRPDRLEDALAVANEAISLAQQGGHEDVRMLAIVGRCRINIEAKRFATPDQPGLFEQLSAAERYAVRMDIPRLSCEVHELRARLLLSQGEYQLSAKDATASLEIAALYDLKIKKARGLLTLAQIYYRRGEWADARKLATMGREIANSCDYYTCVRGFNDLELALDGGGRRQAMAAELIVA